MQYMQLGFDPQKGVEQQLTHDAQADGLPISGLETIDEQLGVLQGLSKSDQAKFLDMAVEEMHDVGSETQSVVSAWRSGDAAKLAALLSDEYKSFPNLYKALVTERNKRWVPQIEKLLHGSQDAFVVVGALHLVGDGGLLELLRRDGIKDEQLNKLARHWPRGAPVLCRRQKAWCLPAARWCCAFGAAGPRGPHAPRPLLSMY